MVHDADNSLVSHSPFVKGLDYMPRSLRVSCLLIINMILFVNKSHFLKVKIIYNVMFSLAHCDTWKNRGWLFSMQEEYVIDHTNGKCHVFIS
jgi:hypothetical protein